MSGLLNQAHKDMYDFKLGSLEKLKSFVHKRSAGVPAEFQTPARRKHYLEELARANAEHKRRMARVAPPASDGYAAWEAAKRSEIAARKSLEPPKPAPSMIFRGPGIVLTIRPVHRPR